MKESILILHNIRSEQNVGSIFRTADAAGISKIYLTGYTPRPTDKFDREAKMISKTALGDKDAARRAISAAYGSKINGTI